MFLSSTTLPLSEENMLFSPTLHLLFASQDGGLPPEMVAQMYYGTISSSFSLTFDNLYSINYLVLSCVNKLTELSDK